MLKVTIIFVGTVKEKYLTEAIAEYEKRLSAYCSLSDVCIRDEKLPERASEAEISAALKREGERILAAVPPRAYLIALCVEGNSEVCLVIGGSDGLSDEVKHAAKFRLSISEMTFPHQLMRVILLEQLYRAFNIASGGKYHK